MSIDTLTGLTLPVVVSIEADKVNMIPPIGAGLGLPLSMIWKDGTLSDETGWKKRFSNPSLDENTPIALTPCVSGTASSVGTHGALLSQVNAEGLLLSVSAPRLNFEMGQLSMGQSVQDLSTSLYGSEITSCTIGSTATLSESGRFTENSRRRNASAQPANFTYQQPQDDLSSVQPAYDLQIGRMTNANKTGNVRSYVHQTATDLPSNGIGISYGDAHNSIYLSSLNTAPLYTNVSATGLGPIDTNYDKGHANHWCVNLGVRQPILVSGNSLSSPDTMTEWGFTETENALIPESATLIIVNDVYTSAQNQQPDGTQPSPGYYTGGRLDLGNHTVMDSAGLIGYEGVVIATAFFNVSRHSAGLASSNVVSETGKLTYSGLNIQVTSGLPLRRNGRHWDGSNSNYSYRYGTDGEKVLPMIESMRTEAARKADGAFGYSASNANCSVACVGRVRHATETDTTISNLAYDGQGTQRWGVYTGSPTDVYAIQNYAAQGRILGDTHTGSGQWTGTLNLSPTFFAEKVPTKVRVVPVLRGFTTETVIPGTAKSALLNTSKNQTFRKPVVDYHIFVSLASRDDIALSCTLTNAEDGDPTDRNDPDSKRLTANMDLSETPCEIWHGIFRINPTELGQCYFDKNGTAVAMDATVMPVHQGANQSGWGLHQTAPFRPIASAEWPRVPRLSGTIEPGGFLQRGNVSHIWDVDTYNGDVFVGVDVIDCNDLKVQTTVDGKADFGIWGRGQVWADGVGDVGIPRGSELLIFRYSPKGDYYDAGGAHTTPTNNPLYTVMTESTSIDYIKGTFNSTINNRSGFSVSVTNAKTGHGWRVHDWVFPQVELMRYLGTEQKDRAQHPSLTANPLFHPTLHCGALRFTDDGRMMMAAIHRDSISATDEFPLGDIGWPLNPLFGSPDGCPPGWYYDEATKTCKQIGGTPGEAPSGEYYDPISGGYVVGTIPQPLISKGEFIGGTDNFGLWPTWSKLIANTYSRSLILMWSDAKDAPTGNMGFDVKWTRAGGTDYATQNWNHEDTWWSGSRIAYWYHESGQRAIPFTYGSYPEVRCSHPQLPRCLPHIFTDSAEVKSGYPLLMPIDKVTPKPGKTSITDRSGIDAWMTSRYNFLRRTRFVPTSIGFTDFGVGPNPHQELGWAGWSFPTGLYDPVPYGDGTDFFQEISSPKKPWLDFGTRTASISGFLGGPVGGWTHHGPLHYGASMSDHPYAVDRTWKQVHAGLGYDIPLHLLKPGTVHIRARAGGNNSIDLEMETPFHRTDVNVVEGASLLNTGFDKRGATLPGGPNPVLGQYQLRTNLWNDSIRPHYAVQKIVGLNADEKVRGPIVSGTGLQAFWSDHPTDHFHSGAIPIHTGTDYDQSYVETNRYAATLIGSAKEVHPLDWVATSEQLQSSVDVHISHTTRPYWDSGSIVTAQGLGTSDPKRIANANQHMGEMTGGELTSPVSTQALGKGQRVLRTSDGTLHIFALRRSGKSGSSNSPTWNHYTKQPFGDVFFNQKALKENMATATFTGEDEVGPLLTSIITSGSINGKVHGSAFASDSKGTIHAIIEIECDLDNSISGEVGHTLYYTHAKRVLETYSPEPVYSWDWTTVTPIAINPGNAVQRSATTKTDLRLPSLAIDQHDNLHLTAQQIIGNNSHVVFTIKTSSEGFVETPIGAATNWVDTRWQCVSGSETTADYPKMLLVGDGAPVVTFRSGGKSAVWANKSSKLGGISHPSGRFVFDTEPLRVTPLLATNTIYYDSIIDELDRLFVVAIEDDTGRTTSLNCVQMHIPLANQYVTANGLGTLAYLFVPKDVLVAPNYKDITMTTNGDGQLHFILGFMLDGTNPAYAGEVFTNTTTESAAFPLDWPGQPSSRKYDKPANAAWKVHEHFMEVWMPSIEVDTDADVIRSINIRWLSVPSLAWDSTNGFYPVGSAQTMSGNEDFAHRAPQLRYQRFWGHDASALDLRWSANELSWYATPNGASRLFYPGYGGTLADPDEADTGDARGVGIAGYSV